MWIVVRQKITFPSKYVFNSYFEMMQEGNCRRKMDFGTEDCLNEIISKKKGRRGQRLEMDTESMEGPQEVGLVHGREGVGPVRGQKGENKCLAKARRHDGFVAGLWAVAEEEGGVWLDVFITV